MRFSAIQCWHPESDNNSEVILQLVIHMGQYHIYWKKLMLFSMPTVSNLAFCYFLLFFTDFWDEEIFI